MTPPEKKKCVWCSKLISLTNGVTLALTGKLENWQYYYCSIECRTACQEDYDDNYEQRII